MPATINIYNILQSPFAVSTDDGERIFKLIDQNFKKDKYVIVDFTSIELIVSTFLNASIGQLYGSYSTRIIQENLSIENMSNEDLGILKKVTDTAKAYFKDKKVFDKEYNKHFPDASK